MRSWFAATVCCALILAWPAPGLAQSRLEHLDQEVRVAERALTDDGVFWRLEVRDRCVVEVRKVELTVACSPWRPLQPADGARTLDFKGEVTLPDGKTPKVRRRGDDRGGEEHRVVARHLSDRPVEAEDDWTLTHLAETPGTWWLPAVEIGALYFEPGAHAAAAEQWLLELALSSRDTTLRFEGGGSVAGSTLTAVELLPAAAAWRCAALDRWLDGGPALTAADPLLVWFDNLEEAQPSCGERAQRAREVACGAREDLAQQVLVSPTAGAMLELQPVCAATATNCGWTGDGPIATAIARRYESAARQGNAAELHQIREAFGPLMGDAWLEQARFTLVAAMDRQLQELIQRGDTQGVRAFVLEQGGLLGGEWQDEALARFAWVEERRDLALQAVPPNQLVHAELHPAAGLEQVMLVVPEDGTGLLDIRTRDGAPMVEQRADRAAFHLIDLDGDGYAEAIRTQVARDDPGLLEISLLRVEGDDLVAAWTGVFEGGRPTLPTAANLVPREGPGWGFLVAYPEYLPDPECRGADCGRRDRAIGHRMWIEYLTWDAEAGAFAASAPPPGIDTLRAPDGRKLRTGGYHERLRSGVWTWWYPDGRKAIEGVYREGLRHGIWIAWHPDGTAAAEQDHRAGQPVGAGAYWDADGNPTTREQLQQALGREDPFFIPSVSEVAPADHP